MRDLNEIISELNDRLALAEVDARESHKAARNSHGAGYDRGYADALKELLSELIETPASPEAGVGTGVDGPPSRGARPDHSSAGD